MGIWFVEMAEMESDFGSSWPVVQNVGRGLGDLATVATSVCLTLPYLAACQTRPRTPANHISPEKQRKINLSTASNSSRPAIAASYSAQRTSSYLQASV
jgi:hypothetical protein